MKQIFFNILLFTALVCSTSCFFPDWEASFDEVFRVSSPDGKVDAVLFETNGGATTSFGYRVFAVPAGQVIEKDTEDFKVATLYAAGRSKNAYGVNLKWKSNDNLVIEYLDAKVEKLLKPTVEISDKIINTELINGINDPDAPPGGMLYNLKKQNPN